MSNSANQLLGQLYDISFVSFTADDLLEALGAPEGATIDTSSVKTFAGSLTGDRVSFEYDEVSGEFRYLIPGGYTSTEITVDVTVDGVTTNLEFSQSLESGYDLVYDTLIAENSAWAEFGDSRNVSLFDERNSTRQTSFTGLSFRGIESDYFVVVDGIGLGRPAIVAIPEENIGSITDRAVYTFNSDPRFGGFGVRVNDFEDSPGVIDIPERVGSTLVTQELPDSVFDFTSGDDLGSYLTEQGAGYFRKVGDFFVPVDESEIQTEADLKNLYFCDPAVSIDPVAQFMDPTTGDIAPTLGGNVPPRDAYDGTSAIERYCVCVDELPFFDTTVTEAGVEGVDFWYDGAISPNFDQDAFWYRGAAPLEEGGDSKYWFKFKNTDTTDELTGGGEYALVATKRDALDNGETLDSLTGEYVFSKSFASPDGIRHICWY